MHGIQAKPVEVVLLQPIQGVVDEEFANCPAVRSVKVDRISPRRLIAIGEELWRVFAKVVPFRSKVVVNHIQQDHESGSMSGLHQVLQFLGTTVTAVRRIGKNSVVSPIAASRE